MRTIWELSWREHRKAEMWGCRGLAAFPRSWQACCSRLNSPSLRRKWLLLLGWAAPFSSCLPAVGSGWMQQRGACCAGPLALPGRVCESPVALSYQVTCCGRSPGLPSSASHVPSIPGTVAGWSPCGLVEYLLRYLSENKCSPSLLSFTRIRRKEGINTK